MAETFRIGLPLLEAAQAQKHVTVNDGLVRLDAIAGGAVTSLGANTPPGSPTDGEAHIVGTAPTGDWASQSNAVAIRSNGGWIFLAPWIGLTLTDAANGARVVYDGASWITGHVAGSAARAATQMRVVETELTIGSGATADTAPIIAANDVVIGVTARVLDPITGPTTWRLGVAGADDRYGSGLGIAAGSYALGVSSSPQAYYTDTPLRLTGEGGAFTGGRVMLAVHLMALVPPA
ncbi:MAG: DUF2793 domain-containing protein [Pseudomonadota bacterium]